MSRFSGLSTLVLTLAGLALLSLALTWPLWKLATTHKILYAALCGGFLVLALGLRFASRRMHRPGRDA
jgi:hypothetical protein